MSYEFRDRIYVFLDPDGYCFSIQIGQIDVAVGNTLPTFVELPKEIGYVVQPVHGQFPGGIDPGPMDLVNRLSEVQASAIHRGFQRIESIKAKIISCWRD